MPKKKTLFEEAADGLPVIQEKIIEEVKAEYFAAPDSGDSGAFGLPTDIAAPVLAGSACGHINKHFVNIDGVLENLYCVLPKDHEGDHEADYDCLRPVDGSIAQARLISGGKKVLTVAGKNYLELTERAYWSDGANTLAADIKPDLAQLAYIKANKGEMLDAEQLVRKA